MSTELWTAYVATVLILMSTPGPSQLLMLSNSLGSGFRRSLVTASGDLTANLVQMIVASAGLVSVIHNAQEFFVAVKWAGVAYLVFLGGRLMFSRKTFDPGPGSGERPLSLLFLQGFMTSAANPKAVIFFAALFPQFIDPAKPLLPQFLVLSLTYLALDGTFLCLYGKFAEIIAQKLSTAMRQHFHRISGGLLIVAAALLGLKQVDAR